MAVTAPEQQKASGGTPGAVLALLGVVGLVAIVVGAILFPTRLAPVEIRASTLFTIGGFPISNSLITGWISIIILALVFGLGTRSMRMVPTGLQNVVEAIIGFLIDLAENIAGREKGREFFALFATIFLYVLVNNWIELVPGFTNATICVHPLNVATDCSGSQIDQIVPLFRSPSADLNFTLTLAISAMVMVQFWSIKHTGFGGWAGKFINLRGGPIGIFVGLLELVSELSRVISFSFRLFGNLFAGDVLLSVIPFLVPWVVVLPFMFLELFVGVIQALIFALLTLAFIVMATTPHGGHGEQHAH